MRAADGSGEIHSVMQAPAAMNPTSWHPSGSFIAFHRPGQGGADIFLLPVKRNDGRGWSAGEPTALVRGPFAERGAAFSPDGRWLAYYSNETGRDEVYVQPFRVQVPNGRFPLMVAFNRFGSDAVRSCSFATSAPSGWRPLRQRLERFETRSHECGRRWSSSEATSILARSRSPP